ncbi:MAG: energy-coupling factor transporter transmembrane component T [Eubacterium sp.]
MERNSTFAARHPVTVFIYWLSGVLFTMMTMRVEVLLGSFFPAALYCLYLEGAKMFKWLAGWFLSVGIFLMVILPLFNHRGATPLFYIQGQAVTKESVLMGAVVTLMLVSVLLWMRLGLYLLDSEKLLYLSGRIVPALGLMLSQIFRMIPLMKKRYIQVHEGLMGLGMVPKEASFWKRARHFARELSVLIAWSLGGNSGDFHLHGIPRVWCREENQFSQVPLPPGRWMVCGCFFSLVRSGDRNGSSRRLRGLLLSGTTGSAVGWKSPWRESCAADWQE